MMDCDYLYDFEDSCHGRPRWEMRTRRPSDPSDLTCIMVICDLCAAEAGGESMSPNGGLATSSRWDEWIESDAAIGGGILFLT